MSTSSSPFAPVRRIVTNHTLSGQASIMSDENLSLAPYPGADVEIRQIWSSDTYPDNPNTSDDKSLLNMGFNPVGSCLNVVDIPPRSEGFLHRSLTLDYTIVLKGQVSLVLDNESKTLIEEGNVVILQAGMHRWDNNTDNWARLIGVLLPSQPPVVNGKELKEELNL
ncbi:hypothetical protein N7452_011414 [Penicillium brevicompactum]|uniref:Uncharacterized protein n=1 Tax=Penicillium brevicompactum TaxID=5074 RepID=A0A9W9Q256_PENBR|nr:hypothetical protein N7452_011414 [Penicillium brevicompactum]